METGERYDIRDPYPGEPFLSKKRKECSRCKPASPANKEVTSDDDCEHQAWTKDATCIPETFSYISILEYSRQSGKLVKDRVEKPVNRGYTLFYDGYVHDVYTCVVNNETFIKCKCFKSLRKNDRPHEVRCSLFPTGLVKSAKCSCVAGSSGFCNHLFALLYELDHAVKMKSSHFRRRQTCTEQPAQWTKSRTDGVRAEPVMSGSVVKPKYGGDSTGIKPLLQDTRRGEAKEMPDIATAVQKLSLINPLLGVCRLKENEDQVPTRLGFQAPRGSLLAYQLAVTEGGVHVEDNTNHEPNFKVHNTVVPPFPWKKHQHDHQQDATRRAVEELHLDITEDEAVSLEKGTKAQAESTVWHRARKYRLTASTFGKIVKRKKDKDNLARELIRSKDISNVPAVRYGLQHEERAVKQYAEYRKNRGIHISVHSCGLVVNPAYPWLAASPDRIVFDRDTGYGLIEVKCSFSKRSVAPKDACMDESFFCSMQDGAFKLKMDHVYYAQVQGQLGICGASYCDFVVYTDKGLGVQRVLFNEHFFQDMLRQLEVFFLEHFVPIAKADN